MMIDIIPATMIGSGLTVVNGSPDLLRGSWPRWSPNGQMIGGYIKNVGGDRAIPQRRLRDLAAEAGAHPGDHDGLSREHGDSSVQSEA